MPSVSRVSPCVLTAQESLALAVLAAADTENQPLPWQLWPCFDSPVFPAAAAGPAAFGWKEGKEGSHFCVSQARAGTGEATEKAPERYSSRVVQFFEKRCNSLADFCLCGYFLVDFARGVAKMLVSGLPSLAAKDGHGRATEKARER